jgi:hypothetical protein
VQHTLAAYTTLTAIHATLSPMHQHATSSPSLITSAAASVHHSSNVAALSICLGCMLAIGNSSTWRRHLLYDKQWNDPAWYRNTPGSRAHITVMTLPSASREHHQWQNTSYQRLSDGDRDNHAAGGNGDAQATICAQCWVSCPEPTRTWKWAQAFAR